MTPLDLQADEVMDKQDEVIGELRARLAALEAAAREGPSDAQCDAVIDEMGGRIWEYSYDDGGKPYLVNRNQLRASALATTTTEQG
jgi:hypothetical protein